MQFAAPTPLGANIYQINPIPAGVTQVISPSSNTGGVIIRSVIGSGSTGAFNVYADTTPPSSFTDLSKRIFYQFAYVAGTPNVSFLPYPFFLPPNWGVWIALSSGANSNITMNWDFVQAGVVS